MTTSLAPIPHASDVEKQIVGKLVTDLLAAGYSLSIYDGGETVLRHSTEPAVIFPLLSSTDSDIIRTYRDGRSTGFVLLVWGNDADVITDYGVSLESALSGAFALAEELGA